MKNVLFSLYIAFHQLVGFKKKKDHLSLNFVSSCLPCLSPFFDFYLPVFYYTYFFLVCISLPISSVLSWFSFLFLLRVFLPSFRRWVFSLSFFCPFAFLLTVVFPYFLIPYILESYSHSFYSFRRIKNQMWIWIACWLDSRSCAGLWKKMLQLLYVP